MKILQIYSYSINIGGHFRSGLAMAKGLVAKGHEVIVIAAGATPEMQTSFEKAGVALHIVRSVGRSIKLPCPAGWQHIAKIAKDEKIDVIHAMDFGSIARSYLASIKEKKAFFCTESGGASVSHYPPPRETVIIFSEEQASIYNDIYMHPKCQTKVIRARIDPHYYYPLPPSADFMQRHKLDQECLKVGIATRLESSKSHKINSLIDFAQNHTIPDQIHIYVVGDGDLRESLLAKADQIENKTAKVHFLGPIHGVSEMNQFYNACDVVAGSGRGIMEAMACKKAVIIIGNNGEAQLIGPENIKECSSYNFSGRHFQHVSSAPTLGETLTSINRDPSQLMPVADFCHKYFTEHLASSVGAEQLMEIYQGGKPISTITDFIKWYIRASAYITKASLRRKLSRINGFRPQAS